MDSVDVFAAAYFLVSGLIGVAIAHWKKRSKLLWFVICAFTSILGIVIALVMPKAKTSAPETEQPENIDGNKKSVAPAVIFIAAIVGIAMFLASNVEQEKEQLISDTRALLLSQCQEDATCMEKVSSNYDSCINRHISIKKRGKISRDVVLDSVGLKQCMGLTSEAP